MPDVSHFSYFFLIFFLQIFPPFFLYMFIPQFLSPGDFLLIFSVASPPQIVFLIFVPPQSLCRVRTLFTTFDNLQIQI